MNYILFAQLNGRARKFVSPLYVCQEKKKSSTEPKILLQVDIPYFKFAFLNLFVFLGREWSLGKSWTEMGNIRERTDVGEEKIMNYVETEDHSCHSFTSEIHIRG